MIVLNIFMIAIALVVITNVHHGSAKPQCERLLTTGTWFKMGNSKRIPNFKRAYENVSISQINEKFKIDSKDSVEKKKKNKLAHELMTNYFKHFYEKNKLSLEGMPFPEAWCRNTVTRLNQEIENPHRRDKNRTRLNQEIENSDRSYNNRRVSENESVYVTGFHEQHIGSCTRHIHEYLFNNETNLTIEKIFKVLYENVSGDLLWKDIKRLRELNTDPDKVKAYSIEYYSLLYFEYFSESYVENANPDDFKSIEDFCKERKNLIGASSR